MLQTKAHHRDAPENRALHVAASALVLCNASAILLIAWDCCGACAACVMRSGKCGRKLCAYKVGSCGMVPVTMVRHLLRRHVVHQQIQLRYKLLICQL